MLNALLWGLLATSSLVVGGLIGCFVNISSRVLGLVLAFGAGVLISAVSYELVFEAVAVGKFTGGPTLGLFAGALTFFFADRVIGNMGSSDDASEGSGGAHAALVIPMLLGIILDGIPESLVIGLGILEGGSVSLAMLVAVFISNLPEAIAGTTGLRAGGRGVLSVLALWVLIAVVCALATVAGFALFGGLSGFWLAATQTFAAGAILTMLANSMMPHAFEEGGKLAGLMTVLGFTVSALIVVFERSAG